MQNFADRVIEQIRRKKSCVVVGLDPNVALLPAPFRKSARGNARKAASAIVKFNKAVIDIVTPYAIAVKPQIAYYELWGSAGMEAYAKTCTYARKKKLLVIADIKRGDVPDTAEAYAEAYLGKTSWLPEVDAVTVNPLFGTDGIQPFLTRVRERGKGLFVLVKTSNPSSKEIQDLDTGGRPLYHVLAEKVRTWGEESRGTHGYSSVGAVVGATYPEQAIEIRRILPNHFFLVPGVGAQGGAVEALRGYLNPDGLGVLVNSSRKIIFAYRDGGDEKHWEKATEGAARQLRDQLTAALV